MKTCPDPWHRNSDIDVRNTTTGLFARALGAVVAVVWNVWNNQVWKLKNMRLFEWTLIETRVSHLDHNLNKCCNRNFTTEWFSKTVSCQEALACEPRPQKRLLVLLSAKGNGQRLNSFVSEFWASTWDFFRYSWRRWNMERKQKYRDELKRCMSSRRTYPIILTK